MTRTSFDKWDYYGALLEALREGDENQVDHLLFDFTIVGEEVFPVLTHEPR